MSKEKKVRIHNRSKRSFTIPPAPGKTKDREVLPGRAVDLEESTAEKYLNLYPVELIRYDDLVAPGGDEEKEALKSENEALKAKLAALEGKDPETGKDAVSESQGVEEAEKEKAGKKSGLAGILGGKKE